MGRDEKMDGEIKKWVAEEFESLDFGSGRLEERFKKAMSDMSEEPELSIWLASGSRANAKAAYRMIANERCEKEEIMQAHREATGNRNEAGVLLAIQDTMAVNYGGHEKTEGMGYNCEQTLGINCHSCILATPSGVPIGVVAQSVTTRAERKDEKTHHEKRMRRIEEKESYRWLETMKTAGANAPEQAKLIHIADREGDIYELYALAESTGESFVIRAAYDRLDSESNHIIEELAKSGAVGKVKATIPANHKTKAKDREAELSIRYRRFDVKKPQIRSGDNEMAASLSLNLVSVTEEDPPEGAEAIEWVLMTNLEVGTVEEAIQVVELYRQRWKIERFHFVLKSGCEIEKIQQRSVEGIELVILRECK